MNSGKTKHYLKEYLTFSKTERNGIVVLSGLIILTLLLKVIIPYFVASRSSFDHDKFNREIAQFELLCDSLENQKSVSKQERTQHYSKYEAKSKAPIRQVEINSADSSALDLLPGIGPVLAGRILKYRKVLGGFCNVRQLGEVYGLKPETLRIIEKYVTVDTSRIQKIVINSETFKRINAHPYISYEQTKAICNLRAKQKIESLSQLTDAEIFSNEEIEKIRPYLLIN